MTVATIGFFDGVHIGHQKLINYVIEYSLSNYKINNSLVITFDTVPKVKDNFIYPLDVKLSLLRDLGVKKIKLLKFTEIRELSPSDFFKRYIVNSGIKTIIVGENFKFGYLCSGNTSVLKNLCREYKINFFVIRNVCFSVNSKTYKISSSLIREYISKCKFQRVERFLGRDYLIRGKRIKGKGIGKMINVPTINFLPEKKVLVPYGVFAGECIINNTKFPAVANFGFSPTVEEKKEFCGEVNIIGTEIKSVPDIVYFRPIKKIRDEKKFSDIVQLKSQIEKDIKLAKKILMQEKNYVSEKS